MTHVKNIDNLSLTFITMRCKKENKNLRTGHNVEHQTHYSNKELARLVC